MVTNIRLIDSVPPKEKQEFRKDMILHVKIRAISIPGEFMPVWLLAEDVTPLPEAEVLYTCDLCDGIEPAKIDGSLPDGWTIREYKKGRHIVCEECQDVPTCRICGCSQYTPCNGGCYWVEEDFCSACDVKPAEGDDEHGTN
jgi:hypothetical protein